MTLIIKQSTAYKLPVVLIDDTDFKSKETGIAYGSVTVKYAKEASDGDHTLSTKTMASGDWEELGEGMYLIKFSTSELDTVGKFIYVCYASGILPYYGEAYIIQEDTLDGRLNDIHDTLDAVKTETDGIDAHITAEVDDLITRTKGLDDIHDDLVTAQADLDNPDQFKSDVSALALEATLTAMKGAGWTDETLKAIKDAIDALNNIAASDVWTYATRTLTDPDSYKADVSGLALESTLTAIKGAGWSDETLKAVHDFVETVKKIESNRWKITGNQLVVYDDDGLTPLKTFDLKDSAGQPAMENVYERDPA